MFRKEKVKEMFNSDMLEGLFREARLGAWRLQKSGLGGGYSTKSWSKGGIWGGVFRMPTTSTISTNSTNPTTFSSTLRASSEYLNCHHLPALYVRQRCQRVEDDFQQLRYSHFLH